MAPDQTPYLRYSVSLVTQADYRFYSLTMPSDVLARMCYATTREEDPMVGFQRVLDVKRAQDIASYIDSGQGTIPTSIVLSAQPEAELEVVDRGKTVRFRDIERGFLIIDGQHRVFGFALAKTELRVPVVIYSGLTKTQESRLFIDINTKQRPVPNELLLDIKKLADYEDDQEALMRRLFDLFNEDCDSPLLGLMSPNAKRKGKISRVTFNHGVRSLISVMSNQSTTDVYRVLRSYLIAFSASIAHQERELTLLEEPERF